MNIEKIEYVNIHLAIICKINEILQQNSWTSIEKRSYFSKPREGIFKWPVSLILTQFLKFKVRGSRDLTIYFLSI